VVSLFSTIGYYVPAWLPASAGPSLEVGMRTTIPALASRQTAWLLEAV
jgi:hypothetical protein